MRIDPRVAALYLGLAAVPAVAGSDHVAGWSFDEGSGSIAWDDSGATFGLLDGPTWIEGIAGTALAFDGLDDFVEITDGEGLPDALAGIEYGSISMWFRFDTPPEAGVIHSMLYFGRDWESSDHASFQVEVGHSQVNSKLYWTVTETGQQQPTLCYDSTDNLQTGVWYHYVLVVSEGGNTGYLNGEEMAGRHYNFGSPDDRKFFGDIQIQDAFWLGRGLFAGADQFLGGALDEIRIWDRPLSAAEVQVYFDSFGYDPPDPPEQDGVEILFPEDGAIVEGEVVISGITTGLESGHVRIRIGDGAGESAEGLAEWTYSWDTTAYPDGPIQIFANARECSSCPNYSHAIVVEVDNIPPAITFDSIGNGDIVWGMTTIGGSTTQGGTVTIQIDGGGPIPVSGTNPWTVDLDMEAIGAGPHVVRATLSSGGSPIDAAEVAVIASADSPAAPDCDAFTLGTRLPYPNAASPTWVNTCGDLCWQTVTFHVLSHGGHVGLAAELQTVFDEDPIDYREYVFVEHAIEGMELWEWNTPGTEGHDAIEAILVEADALDAPPHLALIDASNIMSYPAGGGDTSDPNFQRFVDDMNGLVEHLDDNGHGVVMTYVTAHRMNPSNLMAAWWENVAVGDIMAAAEAVSFPRIKPGPDLHTPSWCDFPSGYATNLWYPDQDGLRMMALAWHRILSADIKHPGDVNGDGAVSTSDLLAVLAAWGECGDCDEDVSGDGWVGTDDILVLLAYWT